MMWFNNSIEFISIIGARPLEDPQSHGYPLREESPGSSSVKSPNDKTFTYYTYERSREYPKSNGIYPPYTLL